jgi:hypothetical protein
MVANGETPGSTSPEEAGLRGPRLRGTVLGQRLTAGHGRDPAGAWASSLLTHHSSEVGRYHAATPNLRGVGRGRREAILRKADDRTVCAAPPRFRPRVRLGGYFPLVPVTACCRIDFPLPHQC